MIRRARIAAVVWSVFLLTLVLAWAIANHRQRQLDVKLTEPQTMGALTLRRPLGWNDRHLEDGVQFLQPQDGRRLEIRVHRCEVFLSPLDYLIRSGYLSHNDAEAFVQLLSSSRPVDGLKFVTIGRWPGVLLSQTRLQRLGAEQLIIRKQLLAAALAPPDQMIVLRLEGEGMLDSFDEQLITRVGESVALADDQPPPGEALRLGYGIELKLPDGVLAAGPETFRSDTTLIARNDGTWVAANVVGCLVDGDALQHLPALSILRDPMFGPLEAEQIDPQTLAVLRRDSQLPGAVFWHAIDEKRAILAEFRWIGQQTRPIPASVIELWRKIRAGVGAGEPCPADEWQTCGAAAAATIPVDLADLLDTSKLAEHWQWYDEASPRQSWTQLQYRIDPRRVTMIADTAPWPPLSGSGKEIVQWTVTRDGRSYDLAVTRASADAVSQESHLQDKSIATALTIGREPLMDGRGDVGANFVPGGVLPLVLNRFPLRPMLLRTEWLMMPLDASSAMPLLLTLEPSFDLPKFPADTPEPMNCWLVRINGTGLQSRWYIDAVGRVQSIAFPAGIRLQRMDR